MATIVIEREASKAKCANIPERVKTFEDACDVLGIDAGHIIKLDSSSPVIDKHLAAISAFTKLVVIAEALNEGWKPDWGNNEYKYYPWFDLRSGFSFCDVYCSCQDSDVGSRLCFRNAALAKYAGTQFLDLYKDLMVIA